NRSSGWVADDNWRVAPALAGGVWYWRVQARDNAGNVGEWSVARSLVVRAARGVSVVVSPPARSGRPGATLTYEVTVANTGSVEDTYSLTLQQTLGWQVSLDDASLTVPPGESRSTTLRVTVPSGAVPCTSNLVTVTATSTGDQSVSDSAQVEAHALKAELSFATVYTLQLDSAFYVHIGSRLTVRFYSQDGELEDENVVWMGEPCNFVELLKNVGRPDGKPINKAKLVVTDNEGNVLWDNIASFTVRRDHLRARLGTITKVWGGSPPAVRDAMRKELGDITKVWGGTAP
ncbi:MAG: NEW3 domain-containing protein, partial [Hadesarchaea archaeon]|nr:NEW3 domain-containing protein [Hadesarchaea archaeon]